MIDDLKRIRIQAEKDGHGDAVAREMCRENLIRRGYSLTTQKDYLRAAFV